MRPRRAAWLKAEGLPVKQDLADALGVPSLSPGDIPVDSLAANQAIIIAGNFLPVSQKTAAGNITDIPARLAAFLDHGGLLLVDSAPMMPVRGPGVPKLAARAGVFEWVHLEDGKVEYANPVDFKLAKLSERSGICYWGGGRYFNAWDLDRGMLGMAADGRGIKASPGSILASATFKADADVKAVFTDFAVSAPWAFDALATTRTSFKFAYPPEGEDLACIARLVNLTTGGEIILVGEGVENAIAPAELIKCLRLTR